MCISLRSAQLPKEIVRDTEVFNHIWVLQHEYNVSLEEAVIKLKEIHGIDMREFIALESTLPDFGAHHEDVMRYIAGIDTMILGLNTWYFTSGTEFYIAEAAGYAEPELYTSAQMNNKPTLFISNPK